jgi:hypothetical protein
MPEVEGSAAPRVPTLRPVEEWERGHTVVLAPLDADGPTASQTARLCEATRMELETAEAILAARTSLPVARVSTSGEAELVARLLGDEDLGATIVSDDALGMRDQLRRVRELRFTEETLELELLWGGRAAIARDEIAAIVEGRIVTTRVDLIEGAGRRSTSRDLVDASQTHSEASFVDVYGPSLDESYRIKTDSFDFGCVGRPSHRLDENVAALGRALARFAGASRYDAAYSRLVRLLDHAWPRASRVDSRGLARKGDFRKYTASAVITDGQAQFTRYSRMRYALARGDSRG